MPDTATALAPAKINLTLEILGRRDDGYHDLDTIIQTLELADRVTLDFAAGAASVAVDGPFSEGVPTGPDNLACRAYAALAARCNLPTAIAIHLEKHIPPAGGLGGGASDAATTLRLAQRRFPHVTEEDLFHAANAVGSDEAAFVLGGTVRARGRGDKVVSLEALPAADVLLFVPADSLPAKTATLFSAFSAGGLWGDGEATAAGVATLDAGAGIPEIRNDFERVAFDCFPGLARIRREAEVTIGQTVHLAGAGPTLFWIGPRGSLARLPEQAAPAGCRVIRTATAGSLWKR